MKDTPFTDARPADAPSAALPGIATPEEVLQTLSAILRGEKGDKPADLLKAAEDLARHYGMLGAREEKSPVKPEIAGAIEAAMQALREEHDGSRGA